MAGASTLHHCSGSLYAHHLFPTIFVLISSTRDRSIEFLCKSYPDLAVQARIPELLQAQRADMDRQAAEDKARWANDDDDMEEEEETKLILNGARRGGVDAGGLSPDALVKGPPKTDAEKDRVLDTIAQNGFLRQLDEELQDDLVDCLEPLEVASGKVLIAEGEGAELADKFYIIEEGAVEMRQQRGAADHAAGGGGKKGKGTAAGGGAADGGALARELGPGESFGELALLHGGPREASFVAKSPTVRLWVLSRDAYRLTIMRATEARRNRYKDFLRQVRHDAMMR